MGVLLKQKDIYAGDGIAVSYSSTGQVVISNTGGGGGGSSGGTTVSQKQFAVEAGVTEYQFAMSELDIPGTAEITVWQQVNSSSTYVKVNPDISVDPVNITLDMTGFPVGNYLLKFAGATVIEVGCWKQIMTSPSVVSFSGRVGIYDMGTLTEATTVTFDTANLLTDRAYQFQLWFEVGTGGSITLPIDLQWGDGVTPPTFTAGKKYKLQIDICGSEEPYAKLLYTVTV